MRHLLLTLLVLLACAAVVGAQPVPVVINPTTVEFTPSASHDIVLSDGTPVLTRYELRLFYVGQTVPWTTQDLGKPTPGTGGKIIVVNAAWFVPAAMNAEGYAKVAALGPAGEGVSDPSNPFVRLGPPAAVPKPLVR